MAFPVVAATNTTADTDGTSTVINMPAGIVAGDLLLVWDTNDATGTPRSQSGGSDWTRISTGANGTVVSMAIFAKIAAGGDTLTLAGAAQDAASVSARITGHGVTNVAVDIIIGIPATGTSATPNPPANTPGGPQDYLFLESAHSDDDDDTATYWSTNYSAVAQIQSASSTTSCLTSVGQRALSATSEDPGTMALAASEEWVAQTISVPPTEPTQFTKFTDTFTRSDSADLGADWDAGYTSRDPMNLVGNAVRPTTLAIEAVESINAASLTDNQWIKGTIKTIAGAQQLSLTVALRMANPSTVSMYLGEANRNITNTSVLSKYVAGAYTEMVVDTSLTWAAGDIARLYAIGTRLTFQRNGVSLLTTVDSSHTTGKPGLNIFVATGGTLSNCEVEGVETGDYTAPAGSATLQDIIGCGIIPYPR